MDFGVLLCYSLHLWLQLKLNFLLIIQSINCQSVKQNAHQKLSSNSFCPNNVKKTGHWIFNVQWYKTDHPCILEAGAHLFN